MNIDAYANPNALVSANWLAAHLDDPAVRVVEVDVSPASYEQGHLPGAVLWDIYKALKDPSYRLVDRDGFERIVRASGIAPSTKVVFYGYGPVLGYWLMRLFGHANASVLNLSKQRWQADGLPWSTEPSQPKPTRYPLPAPNDAVRALQPMVEASIGSPDRVVLDVRSEAEFRGERFWPSGATENIGRAGHIPGARNVVLDAVTNADGSFADAQALRETLAAVLADERDVVTYCTIGNRASIAWFVLSELLGRRGVRVYDGSWAEWGFLPSAPI